MSKPHILIVDNDRNMTRTLVDILNLKGYPAFAAHSGEEALKRLAEDSFDLVLTDIKMPDMNGVELQRAIKQKHPQVKTILMTAYSEDELIEKSLAEGASAALTKPLDINFLLALLAAY